MRGRGFRGVLLLSAVLAGAIASFMCFVGWKHNPQAEFHGTPTGAVNVSYLVLLFASWFVPVFLVAGLLGTVVSALLRRAR